MTIIDFIITVLSLFYIFYATQNKVVCFVFGLLASGLWAYHDFFNLNLKFDGFLQLFYVGMSIWGIYTWKSPGREGDLPVSRMKPIDHGYSISLSLFLGIGLAWLTMNFLKTSLPYLDAVTTALAIVATVMLVHRKIENWLYWVVIDLAYIYIFLKQEAPLLAGIMGIYAILAIYGFFEWRKLLIKREAGK